MSPADEAHYKGVI